MGSNSQMWPKIALHRPTCSQISTDRKTNPIPNDRFAVLLVQLSFLVSSSLVICSKGLLSVLGWINLIRFEQHQQRVLHAFLGINSIQFNNNNRRIVTIHRNHWKAFFGRGSYAKTFVILYKLVVKVSPRIIELWLARPMLYSQGFEYTKANSRLEWFS